MVPCRSPCDLGAHTAWVPCEKVFTGKREISIIESSVGHVDEGSQDWRLTMDFGPA